MTCHRGDKQARTWSFQRKCIGAHHLKSHAAENKAGPVMVCIQYFLFSLWKNIPDWTSLEFCEKIIDDVTSHYVCQQTTAMSSCGNFAITGDARGHVDMFNIQSGIHRGCLGTPKGWFLIKCLAWLLIKKFASLQCYGGNLVPRVSLVQDENP